MRRVVVVALLAASAVLSASRAAAASPTVRLDRSSVAIGERVMVIMDGWNAQSTVTITICGNAARRGSVDCAVTRSQGYGISAFDKVHASSFEVPAPPVPCPCVIQVANSTFSQVAFAPIDLVNHATGAIVAGAVDAPISVELRVRRDTRGALARLRSALGGPTTYAVTAVVRNRVGEDLEDIRVTARAARFGNGQTRLVRFSVPRMLRANATWRQTNTVTIPAPGLTAVDWTLVASGAGPVAEKTATTTQRPMLFFGLMGVLVADLGWYAKRQLGRRRGGKRHA